MVVRNQDLDIDTVYCLWAVAVFRPSVWTELRLQIHISVYISVSTYVDSRIHPDTSNPVWYRRGQPTSPFLNLLFAFPAETWFPFSLTYLLIYPPPPPPSNQSDVAAPAHT